MTLSYQLLIRVAWLLIAMIVVGCQRTTLSPSSTATTLPAQASPPINQERFPQSSEPVGQLAYVSSDGNIYVTTADRSKTIAVTTDATTSPEGTGYSYHRISWAPDGRLAFAGVTREGDKAISKLFVTDTPGGESRIVGENDEHFVIYIFWSPVPCPNAPTCRQLAYLIEEEEDIVLRLVEMEGNAIANRVIGRGWPYYFSWHPTGESLLWHTGGAQRYNADGGVMLYDLKSDAIEQLSLTTGQFMAPAWSPEGDQWLAVTADDDLDQLQLFSAEEPITLVSGNDSQAVFAWSPEGNRIAYSRRERRNEPFYGPIYIYDLETGQSTRIIDVGLRTLGFFWSPDGTRIAYLTWLPLPNATWMQWRVYDLIENRDRGFKAFYPSPQMRFVISSFNQYAQSHRFWSPDSRYLVYANRDHNLIERVWFIDTWDENNRNAILVGHGSFGVWSWK